MTDLKKLLIKEHPRVITKLTPDGRYWKKYRFAAAIKEFGAVTHLSFSQEAPYNYTVTCGTKVNVYNSLTNEIKQSISRFKQTAYSGHIRRDGKLIVAGSEDNSIQVFEVGTRSILRQLEGHVRPVHLTRFDETNTHIISGSDDKTVRCWDLATGDETACFRGHDDYVRCGSTISACPDLCATGSYDHTVRFWDKRSGECTVTLDHGSPVESVVVLPSGGIAFSAGSNKIKIWDVHRASLLTTLSNHQKTITCLALDSFNRRLLSSSLDHQVKMYDLTTYKVTHSIKYPAPVLSVGTTANNTRLIVGCNDGIVNIREQPKSQAVPVKRPLMNLVPGTFAYYARGKNLVPNARYDVVSEPASKRKKLAKYDMYLKRFQYQEAFDYVMRSRHNPELVVSVLQELFRRDTMKKVLSGRNEETLEPVLHFLVAHVTNPKHCTVLSDVTHILADLYSSIFGLSPKIDKLFDKLNKRLKFELKVQEQYMKLQGAMECFFTATSLS